MWILGSHNSWSYLTPKKWWAKLISFTAKCQSLNIIQQYNQGVRCFDLRIRFVNNKLVIVHGFIEYKYSYEDLLKDLEYLNSKKDCCIRLIHDIRTKKQFLKSSTEKFVLTCYKFELNFKNIKFFGGMNFYNNLKDYNFNNYISCDGKYASACSPKFIDDLYPKWYAIKNNAKNIKEGTDKDVLLIDFVNYVYR